MQKNGLYIPCTLNFRLWIYCVGPLPKQDIEKLERVQKQAACFITGDYRTREEGCVTGMLQSLELSSLENRRSSNRLIFMYKVVEGLVPAIRMRVNSALGQVGLGSSRPGSTRPDNISAWSYFAYFFIRDASMNCVLYIKCSAKVWGNNDWFYLYCWSVKLVSINRSDFTTVRETDKKYIFELFILIFF